MKMIVDRKFFSLILLLLFFAVKSMSLHPMLHSDQEDQPVCELCEVAVLSETVPFILTQSYQIPENIATVNFRIISLLVKVHTNSANLAFNCRPPPSLF